MIKKWRITGGVLFVTTALVLLLASVQAVFGSADPGSKDNPIILKSYLTDVFLPQIKSYIDEKMIAPTGIPSGKIERFEVIELKTGQALLCGSGTELIIRQGSASIIATEKGGIVDSTDGVDLVNSVRAPANHLLIVPIDDGRGIRANNEMKVMVKGNYKVDN